MRVFLNTAKVPARLGDDHISCVAVGGWEHRWQPVRPGYNNICVIMRRLIKLRVSGLVTFLIVAGPAMVVWSADHGRSGYLAAVGPPALRFASDHSRDKIAPTWFVLGSALTGANQAKSEPPPNQGAAAKLEVFSPTTHSTSPSPDGETKADSLPPGSGSIPVNTMSSETPPAIVTPDMLMNYLKPLPPGTGSNNNPPALRPVNPGFTPPVPGKNSRATYTSQ